MIKCMGHWDLQTMFPTAELLMDNADGSRQDLLIHSLASPGFQYEISSRLFTSRVVAKEGDDVRPLRDDRLSFIALPSFVNFTQSAKLSRNILLTQPQH